MHPLFAKAVTHSPVTSLAPPSWCTESWGLDCWRASMKLLNVPLGLLFNHHEFKLADGISRLILPGANNP